MRKRLVVVATLLLFAGPALAEAITIYPIDRGSSLELSPDAHSADQTRRLAGYPQHALSSVAVGTYNDYLGFAVRPDCTVLAARLAIFPAAALYS